MDSWGRTREVEKPLGVRAGRAKLRRRALLEIEQLDVTARAASMTLGQNSPVVQQLRQTRELLLSGSLPAPGLKNPWHV